MATNLNALVLRIGADTSGVSQAVNLVRRDINRVSSIMRQASGVSGKYQEASNSLAKVMAAGAISSEQYAKAQEFINQKYTTSQISQYAGAVANAKKMVEQSVSPMQRLVAAPRDLITAKRQGEITETEFSQAMSVQKAKVAELNEAERRRKSELDGTAEAQARFSASMANATRLVQQSTPQLQTLTKAVADLSLARRQGVITETQYTQALAAQRENIVQAAAAEGKRRAEINGIAEAQRRYAASMANATRLVQQSTPPVQSLIQSTRDLIMAKRQGVISETEFTQAMAAQKTQMASLNEAERRRKAEIDGTAEAQRRAAEQTRRVSSMIQATIPQTTRLAQQIRELRSEYRQGNVTQDQFVRTNRILRDEYRRLSTATQDVGNRAAYARRQFEQFKATQQQTAQTSSVLTGQLGQMAAAYVSIQAVSSGITTALDMERAGLTFEVFTGSAERGKQVLTDLRNLAATTPLEFSGVTKASQTLLAFGVDVDSLMPTLQMLGDISAGNAERFQSLALVMGQVSANARLNGQDLLQFVNAGFNPLQQIAEKTGKSMETLRDEMSKGQISVKMVEDAMKSATSAGGRFSGLMDRYGQTSAGALSLMRSELQVAATDFYTTFLPAIEATANGITSIVRAARTFAGGLSDMSRRGLIFTGTFVSFVAIVPQIIGAIRGIIGVTRSWIAAQITLQAVQGPKGWAMIAAGLAAASVAMYQVDKQLQSQTQSTTEMAAETDKAAESTTRLAAAQKDLSGSIALINKQTTATRSYIEQYETLQQQNIAMKVGSQYAEERARILERQKLLVDGFTTAQLDNLDGLRQENELLKQRQKRVADAAKAEEERRTKIKTQLQSIASSIAEGLTTPYDQLVNRLAEINAATRAGLITTQMASQAAANANSEFGKQNAPIKVELPAAITRGSKEEYQLLAKIANGSRDREEARHRQAVLQRQAHIDAIKRTNEILAGKNTVEGVS